MRVYSLCLLLVFYARSGILFKELHNNYAVGKPRLKYNHTNEFTCVFLYFKRGFSFPLNLSKGGKNLQRVKSVNHSKDT
jgi:hypothetical protein